jgi:hypothetical protein
MARTAAECSAAMKLYFKCMDTADFETAASLFAEDAVYVRPPFTPGQVGFGDGGSTTFDGLDAINEFWALRGKRNTNHVILTDSVTGDEWFAEGSVTVDGAEPRTFLTHVTFNSDGKVKRFVALR